MIDYFYFPIVLIGDEWLPVGPPQKDKSAALAHAQELAQSPGITGASVLKAGSNFVKVHGSET